MSEVKRYRPAWTLAEMVEDKRGLYVAYSDYASEHQAWLDAERRAERAERALLARNASSTTKTVILPAVAWGRPRSKRAGGAVFTVCDECWDKHHSKLRGDRDE